MAIRSYPLSGGELDLAAALASRQVIPFIGSGFSVEAFKTASLGHLMPSWDGFVDRVVSISGHPPLGDAKGIFSSALPDLLQIVLDNTGTRNPVSDALRQTFVDGISYQGVANSTTAKALRALAPPFIVTTNYDELLEKIFDCPVYNLGEAHGRIGEIIELGKRRSHSPACIIKVHGTAADPFSATVTSTEYQRLFADSKIIQELILEIGTRYSFWFIGYSLRDIDMQWALVELQSKHPYRQHFRHDLKLIHPLQTRVEHIQYNVRVFEIVPDSLTGRLQKLNTAIRRLRTREPILRLFASDENTFSEITRSLLRFELRWSEDHAQASIDAWLTELEECTDQWNKPPTSRFLSASEAWSRFFTVESILRHHLFLLSRFDDRRRISEYVFQALSQIPRHLILDGLVTVAEGLFYLDRPSEEALNTVVAHLRRTERHNRLGNEEAFAFAYAILHRSRAKWAGEGKKREHLEKAVRSAAQAGTSEFQAACLLDLAKLTVDGLITSGFGEIPRADRVNAIVTARAALELALHGGSYRRANMALQRLVYLEDDKAQADKWLQAARHLPQMGHVPKEPRNKLYLALAQAVVDTRYDRRQQARDRLASYDSHWFSENSLKEPDVAFFRAVATALRL